MSDVIVMQKRGVITFPKAVRERLNLKEGDPLLLDVTSEGILLKPAMIAPIEIYSDEQIEEFRKVAEEVEGYRFRK